jgi:hypothetical protein
LSKVFVSYTRVDQRHARRIRDALTSLSVDVLWDESMPAVDWQEYLERSIDSIAAVVVLWTPQSLNSGYVRDEARLALETDKLINIVFAVAKPRFPFDRINGLSIDGWAIDSPHSGWSRIVATVDTRLGAAGRFSVALEVQLRQVEQHKSELVLLEKEVLRCTRTVETLSRELASAEAHVLSAEKQLENPPPPRKSWRPHGLIVMTPTLS